MKTKKDIVEKAVLSSPKAPEFSLSRPQFLAFIERLSVAF